MTYAGFERIAREPTDFQQAPAPGPCPGHRLHGIPPQRVDVRLLDIRRILRAESTGLKAAAMTMAPNLVMPLVIRRRYDNFIMAPAPRVCSRLHRR